MPLARAAESGQRLSGRKSIGLGIAVEALILCLGLAASQETTKDLPPEYGYDASNNIKGKHNTVVQSYQFYYAQEPPKPKEPSRSKVGDGIDVNNPTCGDGVRAIHSACHVRPNGASRAFRQKRLHIVAQRLLASAAAFLVDRSAASFTSTSACYCGQDSPSCIFWRLATGLPLHAPTFSLQLVWPCCCIGSPATRSTTRSVTPKLWEVALYCMLLLPLMRALYFFRRASTMPTV